MRVLARTSRACACVRVKPERLQITIISRRYSSGGRARSICRWRSDVGNRGRPAAPRRRKMSLKPYHVVRAERGFRAADGSACA